MSPFRHATVVEGTSVYVAELDPSCRHLGAEAPSSDLAAPTDQTNSGVRPFTA